MGRNRKLLGPVQYGSFFGQIVKKSDNLELYYVVFSKESRFLLRRTGLCNI